MIDNLLNFVQGNLSKWIIFLVLIYKIIDRIGYFLINVLRNLFLSFLFALAYATTYETVIDSNVFSKSEHISNFIYNFILSFVFFLLIFAIIQLLREFFHPKSVFNYVRYSVKNNNIDNCIWCASTSGQLIKIITKSNKEFIVFPKYSSSYECKIISKKYLRAFFLKKGKIDNKGKVEYYEDNTKLVLQKIEKLKKKNIKLELKNNRTKEFLFEPLDYYHQSSFIKCLLNKPYPKVPFYKILSEFEDRIDFKNIASISIYNPDGNKNDK